MENLIDNAICFAVKAHSGMRRKGTDVPYVSHPLEAFSIAASITNDEKVLAAAVLHDVVEDTDYTIEDIKNGFGEKVAELVASDSENKRENLPAEQTWEIRKKETLEALKNSSREEQIITISDKLSNIRAIYRDYFTIGEGLWQRFNQKDKNKQRWYYESIAENLNLLRDTFAYREYVFLLNKIFGEKANENDA